jgi:hypothetical protein
MQGPKYKGQKKNYLQNTTQKTKPWATRTSLKTIGGLQFSGRVSSSCSISYTCGPIVPNPLKSHEWGNDCIVIMEDEHIRGHLWHRYSVAVNQVMVATVKL